MRCDRWRHWLGVGGECSYLSKQPVESAGILSGIESGVSVDFVGDRTVHRTAVNPAIDEDSVSKVTAVIDADVLAGKKAGPFDEPPLAHFVVSPIGAVPKKNSTKVRVIHNLSHPFHGDSVNAGIRDQHFPLSSFGHAARAVRKLGRGCFLVKLDVEAAYKQVPVRREDWHLLGFKWRGKFYFERVLPFGLKSSCRLWELFAAALHHILENCLECGDRGGRFVIHYVDDFLFVVKWREEAATFRDMALATCADLGLPMAADKTEGPVTKLTFLGIELDTELMQARLPPVRLAELQQLTQDWGRKETASVKELQSLTGTLQFAVCVVRPGRFFLRRIITHMTRIRRIARTEMARFPITEAVRADIAWWCEFLPSFTGHSLLYEYEWTQAKRIELFTDACEIGYGGVHGNRWFAGAWSSDVLAHAHRRRRVSMPFLELFALVLAAAAFGGQWEAKKITFRCDCSPVVDVIKEGRSAKPEMMHLLRILQMTAARCGFDFRAEHIPGAENDAADTLSRHGDCPAFRVLCPQADMMPTPVPHIPLPENE